jgi:hypothetical protein
MVAAKLALQFVQPPTGRVEVLRRFGLIERGELQSKFAGVCGLNTLLAARSEERFQTFVCEVLDYCSGVKICFTLVKPVLLSRRHPDRWCT